jgi:hypothetical protein
MPCTVAYLFGPSNTLWKTNTGNWSSPITHSTSNMVAASVATKTGIIQQLTVMNQLAIQTGGVCLGGKGRTQHSIPHPTGNHTSITSP